MMKKMLCACTLGLMIATSATAVFASEQPTPAELIKSRIAEAKSQIKSVDSATLKTWIDTGEKEFVLLDVREPGEVTAGQIEADETLAIPRGMVEFQFARKVADLEKDVVVYCLKGSRGALATEALQNLGYKNVHNLEGGLLAWINAGHSVSNFFGEFQMSNFDSNFAK
ncbi:MULTISPECIES: rhodanese-like domain-containing protein [Desulfosediminicola]|uniref:rhodanese-like domain-containing protein n=1 Tax=Desulfosediminicola TaxID=2886823 RepID=UPI0010AC55BD|nr:rhodanese-like domain-containing protein [Desulfosediminicola ganghwensis]